MIFTREILEDYYKSLIKSRLDLPDTVVALFSVAQKNPDMYPYWMHVERYSECFYDFWLFMNFCYRDNKNVFYGLVENLEPFSNGLWNEFVNEETIENLLAFHHTDFASFLSVLWWFFEDKRGKDIFFDCQKSKDFMNLLLLKYNKYIKSEKIRLYLRDRDSKIFVFPIKNVGHYNELCIKEISEIIKIYI